MYSINILYEMTNGFRWNNVKTTRNSTKPNINIVVFFCSAFAMRRIYYLPTTEFALRQQNIQSIKNFVLSSIFQYEYGCSIFFLRSLILAQNSIAVLHPKFNFCRRINWKHQHQLITYWWTVCVWPLECISFEKVIWNSRNIML